MLRFLEPFYRLCSFVTFLVLVSFPLSLLSQADTLRLSLDQAIKMARENNLSIKQSGKQVDLARARFRQSDALFLPQISFEETFITTTDPVAVFSTVLKQARASNTAFSPDVLNDPDRTDNFLTRLEFRQPLINPDGFFERKAAQKSVKAAEKMDERAGLLTEFEVKHRYWALAVNGQAIESLRFSLKAARAIGKQTQDFYEQGMVNKADLLSTEVRTLQLQQQLAQLEADYRQLQGALRYLLGMEVLSVLVPQDAFPSRFQPISETSNEVLTERSDLLALKYQSEAANEMHRASKLRFVPSLNAFGSYEWNDSKLFGNRADNYLLGASLKWNLFKGGEQFHKIREARLQKEYAEMGYQDLLQRSKVELQTALDRIKVSVVQIQLAQATLAQAEESYRIRNNRFQEGKERITDVLTEEARLTGARLELIQARFAQTMAMHRLELILQTDFNN